MSLKIRNPPFRKLKVCWMRYEPKFLGITVDFDEICPNPPYIDFFLSKKPKLHSGVMFLTFWLHTYTDGSWPSHRGSTTLARCEGHFVGCGASRRAAIQPVVYVFCCYRVGQGNISKDNPIYFKSHSIFSI